VTPIAVPAADFCAQADDMGRDAVVAGLVVPGSITELAGGPKKGKTTLMLGMIEATLAGLPFIGLPVRRTPVVLVSEEGPATLREALARAGLDKSQDLLIIAGASARRLGWEQLVAAAVAECRQAGASLLVVDTLPGLAGLSGESENDSGAALAAMAPLRIAADEGLAVVTTRHARKSGGQVGEASRGSSAFAGVADTLVLLAGIEGGAPEARRLTTVSRFEGLPPELDIELVNGRWRSCGTPGQHAFRAQRQAVLEALPEADGWTAETVAQAVPALSPRRAREHLDQLAREGTVARAGQGKRGDAFRFWRKVALQVRTVPETDLGEIRVSGGTSSARNRQKPPESRTLVSGDSGVPLKGDDASYPPETYPGDPKPADVLRIFPGSKLVASATNHVEPPGPDEDQLPTDWLTGGYAG